MTVKELIESLSQFDGDLKVMVRDNPEAIDYRDIDAVRKSTQPRRCHTCGHEWSEERVWVDLLI